MRQIKPQQIIVLISKKGSFGFRLYKYTQILYSLLLLYPDIRPILSSLSILKKAIGTADRDNQLCFLSYQPHLSNLLRRIWQKLRGQAACPGANRHPIPQVTCRHLLEDGNKIIGEAQLSRVELSANDLNRDRSKPGKLR